MDQVFEGVFFKSLYPFFFQTELTIKRDLQGLAKFSFGIATSGRYWQLVKLNHCSGEYCVSETYGPIDIAYCEPSLENENVLPLCRNILGMLEESLAQISL